MIGRTPSEAGSCPPTPFAEFWKLKPHYKKPLAAIGLVSTIVQFVDFGNKVVGRPNLMQSINKALKTFHKINDL
jgi:hypothetical protein